jgi:hypothetical protein
MDRHTRSKLLVVQRVVSALVKAGVTEKLEVCKIGLVENEMEHIAEGCLACGESRWHSTLIFLLQPLHNCRTECKQRVS